MRPTLVREFPILLLELVLNQILTSFYQKINWLSYNTVQKERNRGLLWSKNLQAVRLKRYCQK
jgi:hypothetical protein